MTDDTKAREVAARAVETAQHPHHVDELGPDAHDEHYLATVAIDAYLAALPAREPVTEDELAQVVLDSRMSRMGNNPRSLARAILSQFDVTKKGQA